MKVVYKAPGQIPEVREINHSLEEMQGLVDGHLEHIVYKPGIDIWLNEEGKVDKLLPNVAVRYEEDKDSNDYYSDIICGPIFVCGYNDDGESIELSSTKIAHMLKVLGNNQLTVITEEAQYGVPLLNIGG